MSARKADGRPKAPLGATDRPLRARLLKPLVRVLNPLILTVAGRRHMAPLSTIVAVDLAAPTPRPLAPGRPPMASSSR
jgi:hypothetical protein